MAIELQPGETTLGSWTVFHEAEGSRPVTGNLIVTNSRVLFDPKMEHSSRQLRQVRQSMSGGWKANNSLAIDRRDIAAVNAKKGFFSKKVFVSSANGSTHVFNRGMMSIDPILAALQQH